MWEWIQTWTFFNYLALVAFIFSSISVINAFLSLKARFKDWFAIRSKEALRNRLLELEEIAHKTKQYINEPTTLLIDLLWETTTFLMVQCLVVITDVVILTILIINQVSAQYIYLGIFAAVIHFTSEIIRHLQSLRQKMIYVKDLSIVTNEAQQLIEAAKRLGLISDSEITTIHNILEAKKSENIYE